MQEINASSINPKTGKAYAINPSSGVWDDNYFESNYGAQNRATRQLNNDIAAPAAAAARQKTDNAAFLSGQDAQSQDFLNRFRSTLGGQASTQALADKIGQEIGLPQLQANAQALNKTIFNLPATYSKATTGFDVNQNQLDRVVGTKQAELAPAAALAADAAQRAESNVNTRLGYAQRDQDRELLPYQTEQQLLSDRLARETTLYSQANQAELDSLIAKMQAGIQLSEAEKNRAHELSVQEQNYENQRSLNEQQFGQQKEMALGDIGFQKFIL